VRSLPDPREGISYVWARSSIISLLQVCIVHWNIYELSEHNKRTLIRKCG